MSDTEIYKYNHTNSDILIRRAAEGDIETLINISRTSFPNRIAWCTKRQAEKWWKCSITSKCSEIWVCESHKQIAGFVRVVTNILKYQKESHELRPSLVTLLCVFSIRPRLLLTKVVEKIISVTSTDVRYIHDNRLKSSAKRILWGYSMAVAPNMRNRGIGTSMIKFRDQRALELGYDSIIIIIGRRRKVAMRLNEKLGFIRTAKKGNYYEYIKVLSKINCKQVAFSKIQLTS